MSDVGLFALVLWCLGPVYIAAIFMGCGDTDNLEKHSLAYYCYPANSTSNVSWTLVSASGHVTDLGICNGVYRNCTQSVDPRFRLGRNWHTYDLYIESLQREMAGTVVCKEHFTNGTVDTTNCTMRAVSVRLDQYDRWYEVQENGTFGMYCYVSDISSSMIWSLVTLSGETTHLATCFGGINSCTSPLAPYVKTSRYGSTDSYLVITNIKRETGGILLCSDGKETDNTTLDVQSYVKLGACGIQLHPANWSAVASCGFTNAYSTFGRYEYAVNEAYTPAGGWGTSQKSMFDGRRTTTLTPYVNTTDGKGYFRGNYTHSWPLPHLDGAYTYRMYAYPGERSMNMDSIVIERPLPLILQCELSPRESVRVVCVCSTPSVGRPAGRLLWLSGDTVLAAGQYGVTEIHLNVTVGESGHTLTCQLDWILKSSPSTVILLAAPNCPADSALTLGAAVGGYVALGVVLVVDVVIFVVLWRRGTLRGRPACDSPTPQLNQGRQLEEDEGGYTNLDMGQVYKRGKRTGAARTDSSAEGAYENTAMDNYM